MSNNKNNRNNKSSKNNKNNRNNKSSKNTRNNNVNESSLLIVIGFLVIVLLIIFHKRSKKIEPYQNNKRLVVFIKDKKMSPFGDIPSEFKKLNDNNETLSVTFDNLETRYKNYKRDYGIKIFYPHSSLYSDPYIMSRLKGREDNGVKVINTTKIMDLILDKHDLKKKISEMDNVDKIVIGEGKYNTNTINLIQNLLSTKTIVIKAIGDTTSSGDLPKNSEYIDIKNTIPPLLEKTNTDKFIIEEYLEYVRIHRVLVINGIPLNYTFIYNNNDNNMSSKFDEESMILIKKPNNSIINLARKVFNNLHDDIGNNYKGVVAVDIYQTKRGKIYVSDINPIDNVMKYQNLAREKLSNWRDWNISKKIAQHLNRV